MENKPPKGTRDFDPQTQSQREQIIEICRSTCELYGAQPIQTPLFEVKQLIMEKYENNDDNNEGEVDKQVCKNL